MSPEPDLNALREAIRGEYSESSHYALLSRRLLPIEVSNSYLIADLSKGKGSQGDSTFESYCTEIGLGVGDRFLLKNLLERIANPNVDGQRVRVEGLTIRLNVEDLRKILSTGEIRKLDGVTDPMVDCLKAIFSEPHFQIDV